MSIPLNRFAPAPLSRATPTPRLSFTPVWSVVGGRHVGNYWEGYSLKLGRIVQFYSDLEYDHWVLVETDPDIEDFCEQPVVASGWVEGRLIESRIDFWLRRRNDSEVFRGVRYARDLTDTVRGGKPSRSVQVEREWALRQGGAYEVVTEARIRAFPILLQNWKRVLHYLRTYRAERPVAGAEKIVRDKFQTGVSRSLSAVVSELRQALSVEEARLIIYRLLHAGVLKADMTTSSLGESTAIELCHR